jgi:uncharacterized protein YdbL (DUF1318 family)
MKRNFTARLAAGLAAISFAAAPISAATLLVATPAYAQSGAAKAAVDAAKAKGIVGEQGDGYLGVVSGAPDAALKAAIAEINAGRAKVYQSTAASTGVTSQAAGEATAKQLFAKVPGGQYYKPLGGNWTRK